MIHYPHSVPFLQGSYTFVLKVILIQEFSSTSRNFFYRNTVLENMYKDTCKNIYCSIASKTIKNMETTQISINLLNKLWYYQAM